MPAQKLIAYYPHQRESREGGEYYFTFSMPIKIGIERMAMILENFFIVPATGFPSIPSCMLDYRHKTIQDLHSIYIKSDNDDY